MRWRKIRCPNQKCRTLLLVPENLQGTQVQCADCGRRFLVPVPATEFLRVDPSSDPKRKAG